MSTGSLPDAGNVLWRGAAPHGHRIRAGASRRTWCNSLVAWAMPRLLTATTSAPARSTRSVTTCPPTAQRPSTCARLRGGTTPAEVERVLRERIETPMRGAPRVTLEELDADEVVVRVSATPLRPGDGPTLATEVLEAIAPYAAPQNRSTAETRPRSRPATAGSPRPRRFGEAVEGRALVAALVLLEAGGGGAADVVGMSSSPRARRRLRRVRADLPHSP